MLNILLIDDDPVEHRLIQHMLRDCYEGQHILRFVETLEGAQTLLKSQNFDLILLDDKLGHGRTALDSVPAIRKIVKNIPMILISSAIDAAHLKNKTVLDVYDIVDKFQLRHRIRDGLLDLER